MTPSVNFWRNLIMLGTGLTIILMPKKTPAAKGFVASLLFANVAITIDTGARTAPKNAA